MLRYILGIIFTISFILYFLIFGAYNKLDALRYDMVGTLNKLKIDFFSPYDKDILQQKLKSTPATWISKQINNDLKNQCKANKKEIDKFWNSLSPEEIKKYGLVKITINGNEITDSVESVGKYDRRRKPLLQSLKILSMETQLPTVTFIICLQDFIDPGLKFDVPIFAFSKDISKDTAKNIILIPDANNLARWKHSIKTIYYADKTYSWKEKSHEIFWRGQAKGQSRKKILELAEHHGFIDARHASKSEDGYIIPELQVKHKYLLSLDSYGPSLTGFLWKLASNSLVVKQDSPMVQWYYGALKPWVHYVPVKSNLSNLQEIFTQMVDQDKKMRKIAVASNKFVYQHLTYEDMLAYINLALKAYLMKCYS